MIKIKDLHATVAGTEILTGIDLTVNKGEVHAIMGPNGSGKSTFAKVLAGHEDYEVTQGSVEYKGKDLLDLEPAVRAREGIFLGFQYPVEIPGISNMYFLKSALNAVRVAQGKEALDAIEFLDVIEDKKKIVKIRDELLERAVNSGFSGGEGCDDVGGSGNGSYCAERTQCASGGRHVESRRLIGVE